MFSGDKEKGVMLAIAILVIAGAFSLVYSIFTQVIPKENNDLAYIALGYVFAMAQTVIAYYFGSSKSSSDKTNLMAKKEPMEPK